MENLRGDTPGEGGGGRGGEVRPWVPLALGGCMGKPGRFV